MRTALITYLLLSILSYKAQNELVIDSIAKIIQSTPNDHVKANLLHRLAHQYIDVDSKKAYDLGLQSVELSKKINDPANQVAALNELAILDRNSGNFSSAISHLKVALNIAETENDTVSISKCFITVGDVYSVLLNYDKAISYYEEVLDLNKNKQNLQVLNCYNRIGNRLMDKGRTTNDSTFILAAISSYLKSRDMATAINATKEHINAYVSLADAYNIFGQVSNNTHHLYQSLNYSMQSLQLAQASDIKRAQGISYINLGEVYLSLNKTVKAIHYFEMAEKIYEPLGTKSWLLNIYELMGKTYYTMHVYDKAIEYIEKAIVLAKEQKLTKNLSKGYQLLAEMSMKQEKYKDACEYYRLYDVYKDSVINDNTTFNVSRFQTELDLQKKNKEIAFLTKNTATQIQELNSNKTQRNYLIAFIIAVLILLAVVFSLYQKRKQATIEIIKAKNLAEKAKEAQEQFLANTSHEIRTPMNGIIGMTNHLMETSLNVEQQEYISAIKESSNNLLSIINELLDLSKIMAKKIVFDNQPFDLELIIKNSVHLLEFRAIEKKIDLNFNINATVPKIIIGDSIRLKQILLNLVENAVKFTHDGKIEITVDLLNQTYESVILEFGVKDTGIGIPDNKLQVIFENFTQVNAKTTRKYGGTGLGLSISKQLVEQQGGKMSVQSKVNVGSTFTFTLPFKKQSSSITNKENSLNFIKSSPQANLHELSVLVVDDNKINQKVALLTLQKWNVNVELADSAEDAYTILQTKKIDLILMDITMPDIDGFEATKHIRTQFQTPVNNIPIVAMTSAAFVGDKEKCLSAGMNDYISKPFVAEELLQKIIRLVPSATKPSAKNYSDLTLIYERADGDMQFLKEIIECYVLEMPVYIKEMDNFLEAKNIEEIAKQAHKMKAPIALMGAQSLKELYATIEINAKEKCDINELERLINIAKEQCMKTVAELSEELHKI